MKTSMMMAIAFAAVSVWANTPPEITNVRANQREGTKLVDIYYDAADADGDALKIRVEISDNDGAKYSVPALTFTGDIGEGVTPGANKHIIWDAGTDWDGEYSDQMRVKIYAIDAKGFPGLEWGNEVPPGGFLMGQDGGAEGSGPSRHVNIPWSYWLSKYEITVGQYCDFLNAALVSGFVQRNGTTEVKTIPGMLPGINTASTVVWLGDDQRIRWNVNNFEVVGTYTNYPALVTWYGAMAFARYYGYDLPTEAEWEKAARGPDHDDQDEHLLYPWGNTINSSCASYGYYPSPDKPVGYYNGNQTPIGDDMINGYGLYDVIGNAAEWTRSVHGFPIEEYEVTESLDTERNRAFGSYGNLVLRGYANRGCFYRYEANAGGVQYSGFRVARRLTNDITQAKSVGVFDFDDLDQESFSIVKKSFGTLSRISGTISLARVENTEGYSLYKADGTTRLAITGLAGKLGYVRFKMRGYDSARVRLVSVFADGTEWYHQATSGAWVTQSLVARENAVAYYLELYSYSNSYPLYVDDLEILTIPNKD